MASVVICDICGEIVENKDVLVNWTQKCDEGTVTISLIPDKDRCDTCVRKINARLARKAWEELKNKKTDKKNETKIL